MGFHLILVGMGVSNCTRDNDHYIWENNELGQIYIDIYQFR